ncbi:hypothetical protein [Pseudohalioglobus lutimaris]|uniref:Uncharacterized protein n=1 Tax=Pseudohalioglobus lutimaris TaxID=1737061 RepID=A0A2N5X6Y6_9GAMM|nr:hypothetical protein [Pseudohalioglobus lutimaris]PLW70256.1 hypothetical protein C0039_03350 [Pseudohalioglobus lutimaris]
MLPELKRYQQACREFEKGQMDAAVWAQALEMASGKELAAKYLYIHLRVDALGKEASQPEANALPEQSTLSQVKPEPTHTAPAPRLDEDLNRVGEEAVLQAIAAKEVDTGNHNERIWKDALILAKGNPSSARHHYICLRMDSLRALSAKAALIG